MECVDGIVLIKVNGVEFEFDEEFFSEILYVINVDVIIYIDKLNKIFRLDYIIIIDKMKNFGGI